MAVSSGQVVVSTVAVALVGAETDTISGTGAVIKNTHATDALMLGDATVSPSTGFALAAGQTLTLALSGGGQIWAVRGAAADITAHVLRTGV